ncbi:MAG: DUF998 domain-containing protein [Promethearchaeota archaeon]
MEKEETDSFAKRFYNKLTAPRTIKYTVISGLVIYLGLLIIAVVVASITKPIYTIWNNYISDLGSINDTAVPILYDLACIFAGILLIPFHFYLEKHIAPIPRKKEDYRTHRWAFRLTGLGWFINMFGSFFYVGVGIFSADRSVPLTPDIDVHRVCSYGAFGGFTFAAIFIGIALLFVHQDIIPKPYKYPIGLIGIFVPISVTILNIIFGGPLLEWCLLFAILTWIIPLSLFTLRHTEKQLK